MQIVYSYAPFQFENIRQQIPSLPESIFDFRQNISEAYFQNFRCYEYTKRITFSGQNILLIYWANLQYASVKNKYLFNNFNKCLFLYSMFQSYLSNFNFFSSFCLHIIVKKLCIKAITKCVIANFTFMLDYLLPNENSYTIRERTPLIFLL